MDKEVRQTQKTLGSAIDAIVAALEPLDVRSRETAVKAACQQLEIRLFDSPSSAAATQLPQERAAIGMGPPQHETTSPPVDIRTFAQEKNPRTTIERIVVVAYYLSEIAGSDERKNEIDKNDLQKYFKQAGFPLPRRPEQALVNARHAGYLEPLGEGKYRLNPVGHNLAAHGLPVEHQSHTESRRWPDRRRSKSRRKMARKSRR
jgi:hypothetical protein